MSSHDRGSAGASGMGGVGNIGTHVSSQSGVHQEEERGTLREASHRGLHSDDAHHASLPNEALQMSITNDSFGNPLGNNPVFGTTRPFHGQESSLAVEQFLSGVSPTRHTATASHHANPNSDVVAGPMQLGDAPNRLSPPREDVSTASSSTGFAPPIVISPQRRTTSPPSGSLTRKSAAPTARASSPTASSTIGASAASSAAPTQPQLPRSPSGRSPPATFPLFASVAVSDATSSAMPASIAQSSSPLFVHPGHQGFTQAGHLHAGEAVVGGGRADSGAIRSHGTPQRSSANPSTPPTSRRPQPHGGGMPFASDFMSMSGGMGSGLPHSRSDVELRRIFSEREGSNASPIGMVTAGQVLRGGSPGGVDRSLSYNAAPTASSSPRQRGVVRASESSANSGFHSASRYGSPGGGGGALSSNVAPVQPRWMNAVERIKDSRNLQSLSAHDPVLPYDQSKLGLQTRRIAGQGVLTASKLEALVAQQAGGGAYGGTDPAYPQLLGTRGAKSYNARSSGYSGRHSNSPHGMSVLVAHEEALVAATRHGRAASEQSGGRRSGGVRSVASGGRPGMTISPNPRVITALETVTGGVVSNADANNLIGASPRTRGAVGSVMSATGSGGPRMSPTWYKQPHLFPGKVQQATAPHLFATDSSALAVVGTSAENSGATGASHITDGQRGAAAGAGGGGGAGGPGDAGGGGDSGGAGGDGGGGGGGGGGRGTGNSWKGRGGPRRSTRMSPSDAERNSKPKETKKKLDTEGDEDERDERHFRIRNIDALHAIPWDQRRQLPMNGFGTRFFALLSTPRFWEKLDWTVRGSLLTVLPTMVLSLEPSTSKKFPMPSTLAFNAFWITMPTFGGGLRELAVALKGFSFGLLFLCVIVATQPGPAWLTLLLLFIFTLVSSFVAEETKKTAAYVLASTIMQYITSPADTNFHYVGQYYIGLLIALAFGMVSFLVPFVRWSSDIARHYIKAMGNALSIDLQGSLSSFWVHTPLERELNVVHLRQLRATAERCVGKIEKALDEASYEPHSGAYMACMRNRFNFCKSIHNILGSLSHVIELIAENPTLIDTPMCTAFGEQIGDHLAIITSAMDSMVLKIVDFERIVSPQETQFFREARERFQEALSRVREDVILTNENYETDQSDVLLGFFMFSLDEMCEVISQFEDTAHPASTFLDAMLFPLRDLKSVGAAFKYLVLTIATRRTIPRRMKESIKLSLCIVLPSIFQVYTLDNNAVSPMAGAAVIALIYNRTGSESFHYASGRLLGTVLGSMGALLSVQFANKRLWVLYIFIALLSFIGGYVQAAPGFYALGNAIVSSTISICTQYQNENAAMVRIQQNCFAILMYFAIACILWPMRARTKVAMSLNVTLRCMREATSLLLRNLDMPPDASEVTADVSALLLEMNKKVETQARFIPGAVEEPTMDSAEYPEDSWKKIVDAEKKLCLALSMMCFAYNTFMSSRADSTTELSVHWVLLHRIAPHAQDLSDLIYASIDLYLLSLTKMTVVPTSHMARLRAGMVDAHKAILDTYIATVSRKVAGEDDTVDGDEDDDMYTGSSYNDQEYLDQSGSAFGGGGNGGGSHFTPHPPPTTMTRSCTDNAGGSSPRGRQDNGDPSRGADDIARAGARPGNESQERKTEGSKGEDVANDSGSPHRRRRRRRARSGARREDGCPSLPSFSDASSESSGSDEHANARRHKKSEANGGDNKKKLGYLGYGLTQEEAATLRAIVANRMGHLAAGGRRLTLDNGTFAGRPPSVVMASSPGSFGASPPQVNNDTRLMAIIGGDEGLAATLRKKHKVMVKRGKEVENGGDGEESASDELHDVDKPRGDRRTVDHTAEMPFPNASFLNSSFIKNTSFLTGLFSRKSKEHRDLDAVEMAKLGAVPSNEEGDMVGSSVRRHKGANAKKQRERRADPELEGEDDEVDDESVTHHKTPTTSPTRHPVGGSHESVFSDVEDDPKSRHQTRPSSGVHEEGRERADGAKRDGPPAMAHSMPTTLSGGNMSVQKLLGEDGSALEGLTGESVKVQSMAQSMPLLSSRGSVAGPSETSDKRRMARRGGLQQSDIPTAGEASGATMVSDMNVGDVSMPAALLDPDMRGTTTARPSPKSSKVPQSTGEFATGNGKYPPSRSRSVVGEKQQPNSSDAIRGGGEGAAGKTGAGSKDPDGAAVAENDLVDDAATVHRMITPFASNSSSGMRRRSHHSGRVKERVSSTFKKMGDGDGTSMTPSDFGEILKNISFFDADRGEFVLTNHDIHSLEAFLFGTHSIIVHMNDLQKALLEMQHATDLAKRL